MSTPLILAQITDMHVMPEGELFSGVVPTNDMLAAAIQRINAVRPKVDAILATGDLTEHGTRDEYAALAAIIAQANAPVFLIPGNHDNADALRGALPDHTYLPAEGHLHYVIDDYPLRLIGLDTTRPGHPGGELCAERLAWLEARLAEDHGKPAVIFMHHPPFRTGIWWMDAIGLKGAGATEEIVARHDVAAVLCGHVHRTIMHRWGGTVAQIGPSTAHQVPLDLEGKQFLAVSRDPPGVAIHLWSDDIGFVTHTLNIADSHTFVPAYHGDDAAMADLRRYFEDAAAELEEDGRGGG